MTGNLTTQIWQRASVGGSPLLALLSLARTAAPNGYVGNVDMRALATDCRVSESRMYRIIDELVEQGLLAKSRDHNGANAYRIVLEALR